LGSIFQGSEHKNFNRLVCDQNDEDDDEDLSDEETELDPNEPYDSKVLQLREFRIMNGHCNVNRKDNPALGIWVKNQRANYRKGKISQDRIMLLESLGFSWGENSQQQQPMTFDEGLQELQKYKKAMGHCNIHVDSKSPSRLARWVMAQRNEYKRFRKNKNSLLTLDQVGQLKEVGFKWKSSSRK
jgi:Helicase associated domain